ncbi:hypothetical protein JR316_0000682 [Psilocybe cubensis]|uniref:Uncharacterized protein n=1 Tax=Psilocybe cubensis TaxID=181762 RepID=A0ACB8HFX7_PSICU|nr:hypothetical protein JR316_0000682 [Psilocybe cubensis]KAH9486617.1 hypothetical protein JR316_0000682 [Psilocybe cubensis]
MDTAVHNKSSHYAEDSKDQEELSSQFDNTVSLVRNYSKREGWSGILNPTGETKERFDFWGPAYNLLSSSTMKESVARSQPQAEKPQYENQPVGNK